RRPLGAQPASLVLDSAPRRLTARRTNGSWRGFWSFVRSVAGALDRAPAGAVPVDHAHGAGSGGRVLDLHLRPVLAAGARAFGPARADRLHLRGERDRRAREARALGGRPLHVRGALA